MGQPKLPGPRRRAIAAVAIDEDVQAGHLRKTLAAFGTPPLLDTVHSELGDIAGQADKQRATIGMKIVDPIGYGDTLGVGAKVVVGKEVLALTPRVWKQRFANQPLKSDLDRYG